MITNVIEIYKIYETYKYGNTIYNYIKDYMERKKKISIIKEAAKTRINDEGWELL